MCLFTIDSARPRPDDGSLRGDLSWSNDEVVMARVELKDRWVVDGDVESVRAALQTFFWISGFKPVEEYGNEIRVKQGSQFLTRRLVGWFASAATLHQAATVTP